MNEAYVLSNICTTKYTLVCLFYTSRNDCRMLSIGASVYKKKAPVKETGTIAVILFLKFKQIPSAFFQHRFNRYKLQAAKLSNGADFLFTGERM